MPAIILVEPQLGENIGKVARAMLNCGLTDMRLVRPREPDWQTGKAVAAASGATEVLAAAREYPSTEAAVADLNQVYASTARPRDMIKPIATPRAAIADMAARIAAGDGCGVLFGRERSGLVNDDVALSDTVITVPLNPGFSSLNLAQAVMVIGYEWYLTTLEDGEAPASFLPTGATRPARKQELSNLFDHLERELDTCGFLRVVEKRPSMVRNLRTMLTRAQLTEQEVRTLHGIISCLVDRGGGRTPDR